MQTPETYPAAAPILGRASTTMPFPKHQSARSVPGGGQGPLKLLASATVDGGYAPANPPLDSPSLSVPYTRNGDNASSCNGDGLRAACHDEDLPPYELVCSLVDLFFNHVNTWCPLLHRRTTLEALFGPAVLEEPDCILVHAIVATTLRFSSDPHLTDETRKEYHSTSKQRVLLYGLEHSSVRALQALVS
jgi:hypothetical protein